MTERGRQQGEGRERQEQERRETERDDADRREAEALRARLDKLSSALEAHQDASAQGPGQDAAPAAGSLGSAMSLGFRVMSEFVAAVVVGAVIGWQIDAWTGVSPAFLLVFLLFGTAAGFWNVYRIAVKPPGSKGELI